MRRRMVGVAPLLAVEDVERSVAFYHRLGFEPVAQAQSYARLTGGDRMVLHIAAQGPAPPDRPAVALRAPDPASATVPAIMVIEVEDCHHACEELTEAGVTMLSSPAVPPWGGELRAFLRDPDGHLVEINEPTGEANDH